MDNWMFVQETSCRPCDGVTGATHRSDVRSREDNLQVGLRSIFALRGVMFHGPLIVLLFDQASGTFSKHGLTSCINFSRSSRVAKLFWRGDAVPPIGTSGRGLIATHRHFCGTLVAFRSSGPPPPLHRPGTYLTPGLRIQSKDVRQPFHVCRHLSSLFF